MALNTYPGRYVFSVGHTSKVSAIWSLPICGPKWPKKHSPAQGLPWVNSPPE